MTLRYVCSLPNRGTKGIPRELFYADDAGGRARAAAFIEHENRPGRGVYYCIGRLKDGATARGKNTVVELDEVIVDLDLKDIEQTRDEVIACLAGLILPPHELRDSGFGLHASWRLKEPVADESGLAQAEDIMKRLAELLAGDRAPTHRAALLRQPDTDNTKEPEPRRCHAIWQGGSECDISEFADMFDLYGDRPLLTRKETPRTNGHDTTAGDRGPDTRDFRGIDGKFDVDAWFASMPPTGAAANEFQPKALTALLRDGTHPDDCIQAVVDATMKAAEGLNWDRDIEVKKVTARCVSSVGRINKMYDPITGEVPGWLAGEFHEAWVAALTRGKRPQLSRNAAGWHVRSYGPAEDRKTDQSAEAERPAGGAAAAAPKKYRFPLISFNDMRPGSEQSYLVEELFPIAGLALVYGAPKSGKSFWTFDAMMHVTLSWEYRDRAVQQGSVIYCAFEGAHGYRKRSEAFRRHHGLTDERPPMFIVPGRADLIKDHKSLIRDMQGQLADAGVTEPPKAVVLDTLNKSLIGSESKDVDMANYIAAAEAIQKAFDCLVIIVHHHGIEESRPRGHTSLRGAVDVQIKITRDEQNNIIAVIEDMRDGPEGAQIASRLVVVEVGQDSTGKPVTSAAIEPADATLTLRPRTKLSPNQQTMLSLLEEAGPGGLTINEWNAKARAAGLGKHRPATLADLRADLRRKALVVERDGVWLVVSSRTRDV